MREGEADEEEDEQLKEEEEEETKTVPFSVRRQLRHRGSAAALFRFYCCFPVAFSLYNYSFGFRRR